MNIINIGNDADRQFTREELDIALQAEFEELKEASASHHSAVVYRRMPSDPQIKLFYYFVNSLPFGTEYHNGNESKFIYSTMAGNTHFSSREELLEALEKTVKMIEEVFPEAK